MELDKLGTVRIEITRVDRVTVAARQWGKIRDRVTPDEPDNMGYIEVPRVEEVKRTLLVQEVATLDMAAVIKAINGL